MSNQAFRQSVAIRQADIDIVTTLLSALFNPFLPLLLYIQTSSPLHAFPLSPYLILQPPQLSQLHFIPVPR